MKSQGWNVSLDGKNRDTVFFNSDLDKDYILDSLINNDNYNPNIKIRRCNKWKR